LALVLLPLAATVQAQVLAGSPADPNTGSCIPFACFYHGEYEQVYTKNLFPGRYKITGLEFFDTIFAPTGTASGSVVISLSTTSADWNTLSSTLSSNVGSDQVEVFKGMIGPPWTFPGTLKFPFSVPFIYDPSKGNLLVEIRSEIVVGGAVIFDTNGPTQQKFVMGSAYFLRPGRVIAQSGEGLETDFEGAPVTEATSVPDPLRILLLISALVGLACLSWGIRNRNALNRKWRSEVAVPY